MHYLPFTVCGRRGKHGGEHCKCCHILRTRIVIREVIPATTAAATVCEEAITGAASVFILVEGTSQMSV